MYSTIDIAIRNHRRCRCHLHHHNFRSSAAITANFNRSAHEFCEIPRQFAQNTPPQHTCGTKSRTLLCLCKMTLYAATTVSVRIDSTPRTRIHVQMLGDSQLKNLPWLCAFCPFHSLFLSSVRDATAVPHLLSGQRVWHRTTCTALISPWFSSLSSHARNLCMSGSQWRMLTFYCARMHDNRPHNQLENSTTRRCAGCRCLDNNILVDLASVYLRVCHETCDQMHSWTTFLDILKTDWYIYAWYIVFTPVSSIKGKALKCSVHVNSLSVCIKMRMRLWLFLNAFLIVHPIISVCSLNYVVQSIFNSIKFTGIGLEKIYTYKAFGEFTVIFTSNTSTIFASNDAWSSVGWSWASASAPHTFSLALAFSAVECMRAYTDTTT